MRQQQLPGRQRFPQYRVSAHGDAEDFFVFERELVLAEHPQAEAAGDGDGAFGGLDLAAEDVEERGLPRPVGPHQAVALAGLKAEGDAAEEDPVAEGLAEVGGGDHVSSLMAGRA